LGTLLRDTSHLLWSGFLILNFLISGAAVLTQGRMLFCAVCTAEFKLQKYNIIAAIGEYNF